MMKMNPEIVLNSDGIIEMFDKLGVSIAVFDLEMNMIYMNEKAKWFYQHVFGAKDLLAKNVQACHEDVHIRNIKKLMETFEEGKPFNFFHADPPMIEGGQLTVIQYPYIVDGVVKGMMEINVESSLAEGGRGEYVRAFSE